MSDAITQAVRNQNLSQICTLLMQSPNKFSSQYQDPENGYTALHYAAKQGQHPLLHMLMPYCSMDETFTKNHDGLTPLALAAKNKQWDFVKHYMRYIHTEELLAKTHHYHDCLYYVILQENPEMVNHLLDHGAQITSKNQEEKSLLEIAADENKWDIIKVILDKIDNHAPLFDIFNKILHIAIKKNERDVVLKLINKGADVYAVYNKKNALQLITEKKYWHILEAIIDKLPITDRSKKEYGKLLFDAVVYRKINLLSLLLSKKADVAQTDTHKNTAIQIAAKQKKWELVECFAEYQTDKDDKANYGIALLQTLAAGQFAIANKLIDAKANLNIFYQQTGEHLGFTALHFAILYHQYELVEKLLKLGANPETQYPSKQKSCSAHEFAFNRPDIIALCLLLRSNIQPNYNLLIKAAQNGQWDIVETYIEQINVEERDSEICGEILHIALEQNKLASIERLIELGADTTLLNKDGHAPIHIAIVNESIPTIKILIKDPKQLDVVTKHGRTAKVHLYDLRRKLKNPNLIAKTIGFDLEAYEVKKFSGYSQNTHTEEVECSINICLKKLVEYYPQPDINKIMNEIEIHLQSLDDNHRSKTAATLCFHYIKNNSFTFKKNNNLKLINILCLSWLAANDPQAKPKELKQLTREYIQLRVSSLIDKLDEVYHGNSNTRGTYSKFCEGGIKNGLVESQNNAHPCISIVTTNFSVAAAARENITFFVRKYLHTLDINEQEKIISEWDSEQENNCAEKFRENAANNVSEQLKLTYDTLLKEKDLKDIIDNFEYLPCPIESNVFNLKKLILSLPTMELPQQEKIRHQLIKFTHDITYQSKQDDEYQRLNHAYQAYNELNQLIYDINIHIDIILTNTHSKKKEIDYFKNKIKKLCDNKNISLSDKLIRLNQYYNVFKLQINILLERKANPPILLILHNILAEQANKLSRQQNISDEEYNLLNEQYSYYLKIVLIIQDFENASQTQTNQSYIQKVLIHSTWEILKNLFENTKLSNQQKLSFMEKHFNTLEKTTKNINIEEPYDSIAINKNDEKLYKIHHKVNKAKINTLRSADYEHNAYFDIATLLIEVVFWMHSKRHKNDRDESRINKFCTMIIEKIENKETYNNIKIFFDEFTKFYALQERLSAIHTTQAFQVANKTKRLCVKNISTAILAGFASIFAGASPRKCQQVLKQQVNITADITAKNLPFFRHPQKVRSTILQAVNGTVSEKKLFANVTKAHK